MKIPQEKLLKEDPFPEVLGQEHTKQQLVSALLSERNILIMGPPGVGKTTLAKSVGKLVGKDIIRVQGSPDLTVEDLLGDIDPMKALEFGPLSKEAFTPGKIFKADKGIFFFDELNRAPEKLQNALLQVLQEGYATLGSYDVDFPTNFVFIATMNPEDSSTEKVADVLLDRFDVIYMTYPETKEQEMSILGESAKNILPIPASVTKTIVSLIHVLRNDVRVEKKPSVRATLGLYERSQAHALLQNKTEVSLEDVEAIMTSVLAHRISLKPSVKYSKSPEDIIKEAFAESAGEREEKEGDVP